LGTTANSLTIEGFDDDLQTKTKRRARKHPEEDNQTGKDVCLRL
jgi:hypothetical protein